VGDEPDHWIGPFRLICIVWFGLLRARSVCVHFDTIRVERTHSKGVTMSDEELHNQETRGVLFEGRRANQPEAASREVSEAAISHNQASVGIQVERSNCGNQIRWYLGPLPQGALPWPERAVYFMREVLGYSHHETAVLLGLSDREVDHLKDDGGILSVRSYMKIKRPGTRPQLLEPGIRLRLPVLSGPRDLMNLMHTLFRGRSVLIAHYRLPVIAIILLSLATGGWAQLVTPTVSGPSRSDSFQTVEKSSNSPDPFPVALPDDPGISADPSGTICGTVTDGDGDIVPEATVLLEDNGPAHQQKAIANDNGFFQFANISPGASYHVIIHAEGFADWSSDPLRLQSGQVLILNKIALLLKGGSVSVRVTASTPEELAVEQVRIAEQQRILGFIPNFWVVYDRNPVPLTPKLKFRLALRVAMDPVTFFGVATMAAIDQAANTPNYVEGAKGYGQRFGATYADAFTDAMLAGAVLPTLLHQDPRYFYQGTGTTRSRLRHALFSPFICMGDNGKWQPNYSSLGGNLGTTAMSELWYPESNRGYKLVFGNFLIGEAERMVSGIAQEFLLRKVTPGAAKNH
jgi:hypothetical protein